MWLRWAAMAAAGLALSGCGALQPARPVPPAVAPPPQWHSPLPHGGQPLALTLWWQQFDDPMVARLVAAAQAASPTLSTALSRLQQARAATRVAEAALLPRAAGSVSAARGRADPINPLNTTTADGLTASWELDLFGAQAAGRDAARARREGAAAGWHEARVAVAAAVGQQYTALRACEAQLDLAEADARSRAETARLSQVTETAGFQSPANAALARASASQARSTAEAQRAVCETLIKALVELTAIDEPQLRQELQATRARLPRPAAFEVAAVPAEGLQQRPDLARAALEAGAAAAEVAQARAQRLPSLSLTGSIGRMRISAGGLTQSDSVWSLGPLQLSLPVFDGGRGAASEDAALARYEEAAALYRARLRQAVREVEEALVALDSLQRREPDVRAAADGFERSLRGTETRYRSGLASLFELEDARRSAVQARTGLVDLERQRVATWIALYQAVGGGWTPAASTP